MLPENTEKVTTAVARLLGKGEPPAAKPAATPSFVLALKRCQAATQSLDRLPPLEPAQRLQLAAVLMDVCEKAKALGVRLLSVVGLGRI